MKSKAAMPDIRFISVYRRKDRYQTLLGLLKDRPRRMNISHKRVPTAAEHRHFVGSKPYAEWHFILIEGETAGSVYLSKIGEIGIFLFKRFQGKGLEKKAVRRFIEPRRNLRLLANVSPANGLYRGIFKSLGFKQVQETYCLEPKGGR